MRLAIEDGDKINLKTGYIVDIIEDQSSEPYRGLDVNNGDEITFREKDIECIKKSYIKPVGGDGENYWYFYCGSGYKTSDIAIANWARYELENIFFEMSEDEIIRHHLYWGTEGPNFKASYNGDTYVLFNNINQLPEELRADAKLAIYGEKDDEL